VPYGLIKIPQAIPLSNILPTCSTSSGLMEIMEHPSNGATGVKGS
jgi:hypothetical protein